MNRLSLLNGQLPTSSPKQNMKQMLCVQYLKSFSETGLQTLQKLQTQFDRHFCRQQINEDLKALKKIKTLISSYQVFILEISDCCQSIQVPEFGKCILKVFIQLMGILKWSLQHVASQKKGQGIVQTVMQKNAQQSAPVSQLIGSVSLAHFRRVSHGMRNTFNGTFQAPSKQKQVIRCAQCSNSLQKSSQNEMYKMRQQTTMQLKDMNEQIMRISQQYSEEDKKTKKQQVQRSQLKRFIQKRQQQGKAFIDIGLGELSKNQQILTEVLYTLNRKGEAIARFADLRISSLQECARIQQSTQEQYASMKQEISTNLTHKVSQAKHKLSQLFKQHLQLYQLQRRKYMTQCSTQISQIQAMKLCRLFQDKTLKKLKQDYRNLQKQLQCQRDVNQGLRGLLVQKSHEFEERVLQYRNQVIALEMRSRKELRSTKGGKYEKSEDNLLGGYQGKRVNKVDGLISLVSIDINDLQPSHSVQDRSEEWLEQSQIYAGNSKAKLTKKFLKTRNRLSRTKNVIKIQSGIDRSACLTLESLVVDVREMPKQTKFKKVNEKTGTRDFAVQTAKNLIKQFVNSLSPDNKPYTRKQKRTCPISSTSTPKNPRSRSRVNIISYTKKCSSHMGDLCDYFQIKKHTKVIQQGYPLNNNPFSRLLNKNSKVQQQKNITQNPIIQDKQAKNQFVQIVIPTEFKDMTNSKRVLMKKAYEKPKNKQNMQRCRGQSQPLKNEQFTFQQRDLLYQLFKNEQNAKAYEQQSKTEYIEQSFLEDVLKKSKDKPQTPTKLGTHSRNQLSLTQFHSRIPKRGSRNSFNYVQYVNTTSKASDIETKERITQDMFKKLQILSFTNSLHYHQLRNILLNPYSIFKTVQNKQKYGLNIQLGQRQDQMTPKLSFSQFKVIMNKIDKIHQNCQSQKQNPQEQSKVYCSHLTKFFQTFGITT